MSGHDAVLAQLRDAVGSGHVLTGDKATRRFRRGYRFDATRIDLPEAECTGVSLTVTEGQMDLERRHLEAKLAGRAPDLLPLPERLEAHPIFRIVPGDVEPWERALTP